MALKQEQQTVKHLALLTFRRDLPGLMKDHYREWVAYHGDRRVGIAKTNFELYQLCDLQGIPDEECIVVPIDWEPPYEIEIP